MKMWQHILVLFLLLIVVSTALMIGIDRGDLYEACTSKGDAEGGSIQWVIHVAWVTPMVLVAYILGAVMARPART